MWHGSLKHCLAKYCCKAGWSTCLPCQLFWLLAQWLMAFLIWGCFSLLFHLTRPTCFTSSGVCQSSTILLWLILHWKTARLATSDFLLEDEGDIYWVEWHFQELQDLLIQYLYHINLTWLISTCIYRWLKYAVFTNVVVDSRCSDGPNNHLMWAKHAKPFFPHNWNPLS